MAQPSPTTRLDAHGHAQEHKLHYDVKAQYGAKGDGSTDDSSLIQDVIDEVEAAGGGAIYFQPGTYLCASTLTIDSDSVGLVGASSRATRLRFTAATRGLEIGDGTNNVHYTSLRNLTLSGNAAGSPSGSLLRLRNAYVINLTGLNFLDAPQLLTLNTGGHIQIAGNTFSWNNTIGTQIGMDITPVNTCSIIGNSFEGQAGGSATMIRFANASQSDTVSIIGNTSRQNADYFLNFGGSTDVKHLTVVGNNATDVLGFLNHSASSALSDAVIAANTGDGRGSGTGINIPSSSGTIARVKAFGNTMTSYTTAQSLAGTDIPAYTPTNVTTDRSYDADTVLIAELADVVGTLIADLQAHGVIR